jgi:flagellar hook-length control protein FliK
MGLIQFAGFEGLQAPDVTALNRLSGQSGGEGVLYQPLGETIEQLVLAPLPELASDESEVDETDVDEGEAEEFSQDDSAVEQLQAFTRAFPAFPKGGDVGHSSFMLTRVAVTMASREDGTQSFTRENGSSVMARESGSLLGVEGGRLSPSLSSLMGTSMPAGEKAAANSSEPVSAQLLSSLLAKSNTQNGVLQGRFSLPAVAGMDAGVTLDSQAGDLRSPDNRQLLTAQLSPQISRPADYQWAPARLSDNQTQWGQQLVDLLRDKVELQVNQQVKQAHIRLDPPELGRLELTVKLDGDRLNVQLNVTNPAVRDAMIQSMERLRMSLSPHHAGGVEVNVGQGSEQGQQERWQQDKILAGRRQWQDESDSVWNSEHDWLNTLV